MPTYNSLVSRADLALPEDKLSEIFSAAGDESVVMKLGRRLRNMRSDELKFRITAENPIVYFVDEVGKTSTFPNTNLKQTTSVDYNDVTIYGRELAAIIPIPEATWNDADFDLQGDLKNKVATAIAQKIDAAILFGTSDTDAPDDWPDGIFTGMPADHQIVLDNGSTDLYDNLLGADGAFSQVEQDGYEVTGIVAGLRMRGLLRGLREPSNGAPIFMPSMVTGEPDTVAGVRILFPRNGGYDASEALAIVGDWTQLVYSVAEDVKFKLLTEAVIQDGNGAIVYNLAQQDMVALRVTFRMGWALPLPATWITVSGLQYPFAAVVPAQTN